MPPVQVRELAATFTAKALTAFVDTRGPVEACCVSLACVMHLALASSVWWLHSVSRYKVSAVFYLTYSWWGVSSI